MCCVFIDCSGWWAFILPSPYRAMPGRSTESWAGTGQPPPAARSSPELASCRNLSLGISAGCPEGKTQQVRLRGPNTEPEVTKKISLLLNSRWLDMDGEACPGYKRSHLGRCPLVGVFSGLERPHTEVRQLGLENRHAPSGGRQQLEGRLQSWTQGRLSLHGLFK